MYFAGGIILNVCTHSIQVVVNLQLHGIVFEISPKKMNYILIFDFSLTWSIDISTFFSTFRHHTILTVCMAETCCLTPVPFLLKS